MRMHEQTLKSLALRRIYVPCPLSCFHPRCACSKGDPSLTIAARYDLNKGSRQLTGAVDGKVVGAADVDNMRVHAISGPSTEV